MSKTRCGVAVLVAATAIVLIVIWRMNTGDTQTQGIVPTPPGSSELGVQDGQQADAMSSSSSAVVEDAAGLGEIGDEALRLNDIGASVGHRTALGRTRSLIDVLKAESTLQSVENLDTVDDFYYPGYFSQTIPPRPFDAVERLLSNRRFLKLVDELSDMREQQRAELIRRHLRHFVEQYQAILASAAEQPDSPRDLFRISEVEGMGPTLTGTRYALQSLVMIAALTGTEDLWPDIQALFTESPLGPTPDLSPFGKPLIAKLEQSPMLPDGIRAQAVYLMASNGNPTQLAKVGLDSRAVLKHVNAEMTEVRQLPDFRAEVGPYDMLHKAGLAVDLSHGSLELEFLTTKDHRLISAITDAALAE
ncbi:MAG: hypothetical protein KGY81_10495 [Phycisphaerae bacterium]|jgi:hypothetical protein|nr:hypothetical protein [Phycisphaerae bacterium]